MFVRHARTCVLNKTFKNISMTVVYWNIKTHTDFFRLMFKLLFMIKNIHIFSVYDKKPFSAKVLPMYMPVPNCTGK